jgi:hypothetical protein
MSNFSHLKKLNIDESRTAEYVLNELDPPVKLTVRPASEANKQYFNAVIRLSKKRSGKKTSISLKSIEEDRKDDLPLFAKYIIVDWSNCVDASGKEVEFSSEECEEFLTQLPSYLFNQIRVFCSDITNFYPEEDDTTDEELGEYLDED